MFNQAATVALRILLFRAGPQDLPYSAALTRIAVAVTALSAFAQYRLTLPAVQALAHAIASLAALAAFTWVVLQSRGLANRFQQTLNGIFLTDAALTVPLLVPLATIAPHMLRIAQNPDLAQTEPVPAGPALLVIVLTAWNFMVSAHIYRHALDARLAVGALVALLGAIVTMSLAGALTSLVSG